MTPDLSATGDQVTVRTLPVSVLAVVLAVRSELLFPFPLCLSPFPERAETCQKSKVFTRPAFHEVTL